MNLEKNQKLRQIREDRHHARLAAKKPQGNMVYGTACIKQAADIYFKPLGDTMIETMTLDPRTMIIKSDNENDLLAIENDLSAIIDIVNRKDKKEAIHDFLEFAAKYRIDAPDYKFNREDCYDR